VPVPEEDLPVVLPEDVEFDGVPARPQEDARVLETTCPKCGGKAERETDTFDTFFESSWYYARFACPDNERPCWTSAPTTGCRWTSTSAASSTPSCTCSMRASSTRLMRDEGLVNSDEPFTNLLTQGMVLKDGAKMSKSKGNTVDPQALIDRYGADTVRLFTMFAAPPEQSLEWSDSGVEGAYRFLKRCGRLVQEHVAVAPPRRWTSGALTDAQRALRRKVHETMQKVSDDMGRPLHLQHRHCRQHGATQ
jgi:leucyl-tRNA synthetase